MGNNICAKCNKKCNLGDCGNAIAVDFPYGSDLDSMDRYVAFCSTDCLINYILINETEK